MTGGWPYRFREDEWLDARQFLSEVNWRADEGHYLFAIIDSVLEHRADEMLALTTSVHDLVVALKPIDDPPLDVILVAAPGSIRIHTDDSVRIDYIAVNGENTKIIRPADEAVPLFWRFLRTEFGLSLSEQEGPNALTT